MEEGKTSIEGVVIKKLVRHKDERGFFEEIIRVSDPFFQEGFGQLSHSLMYPPVIKAWHIHKTQVDWWYIDKGTVKAVVYDNRPDSPTYKKLEEFTMGEFGENIVLKIPPGVAHGCKVLGDTAELVYITSGVYTTDEEGRIPYDDKEIGYDWLKGPEIK
jgi:dTDP-4-dehydrorhamnose 3,5-epimerase